MVKYTNKPKGRPTKRKTLKVKYKIERKVKQHKKRVKKEAKKLRGQGLKHKGQARAEYLPNMFPFKQQILQDAKKARPQEMVAEVHSLDQSLYGLINIENKCAYLPKPKDNLIKKYVSNIQFALQNIQIVIELLDVRNPQICIDQQFRKTCSANKVMILTVITKLDTLKTADISKILPKVQYQGGKVLPFTTDNKNKGKYLEQIIGALKELKEEGKILVAGKSLTGKHTFITQLAKHLGKYQESPYELNLIKITNTLSFIDSPFKIADITSYPLFIVPNPILEESLFAQQEGVVRALFVGTSDKPSVIKRIDTLQHFQIQDFTTVSDLLLKVGKVWKIFGKGGSTDVSRVRTRILSDWFNGKLNSLLPN